MFYFQHYKNRGRKVVKPNIIAPIREDSKFKITFLGLLIIYMVQTLPVSLYMLGNYFRTIPYSIEEAALMEGCTRFGTIRRIIIPLSYGAIFSVFIYAFMIAWNEYLFASVFLKGFKNLYTLPFGLRELYFSIFK